MSLKKRQRRAEVEAMSIEHNKPRACTCKHGRNGKGVPTFEPNDNCPIHASEFSTARKW